MNIALIGGMGSGKTTILTEFQRRGYERLSWADPVKEIARWAYGHVEKNELYTVNTNDGDVVRSGREILQRIGTDALRDQVDQDFWIRCGLNRMKEVNAAYAQMHNKANWVNDDSRFPNEIAALRFRGFVVVRLVVSDATRAARLSITDDQLQQLSEHPSEKLIASLHHDLAVDNSALPPANVADAILYAITKAQTTAA